MSHHLRVTHVSSLVFALALVWSATAAEPAAAKPSTASTADYPASAPATAPPTKPSAWHDALKGIPLGPGTLDIHVNIRSRYEFTDNFNVRTYGTEAQDHLLLLRSRLGLDYHFSNTAHVYVEMQDARYWSQELPRSAFPTSNPFYVGRYDTHGNLIGESGVGDEIRHTLGYRVDGQFGRGWDYYSTFAGQFGEYGRDDIAAFGAVAGLGHTWQTRWKPRLGFEFAYASGDHDPTDGVRGTFDGVFGAVDAYYYGWMNVVPWMNLENYQLSFAVHPTNDLKLWLEYNYYLLASLSRASLCGTHPAVITRPTGYSHS